MFNLFDNHTLSYQITETTAKTCIQTAESGIISYANRLKTKLNYEGSVEPIMPIFDVPIQCDMHTSYDFVFQGAWHPDVSSFSADIEAHFELTGTMQLYHDQEFTDGKFGRK